MLHYLQVPFLKINFQELKYRISAHVGQYALYWHLLAWRMLQRKAIVTNALLNNDLFILRPDVHMDNNINQGHVTSTCLTPMRTLTPCKINIILGSWLKSSSHAHAHTFKHIYQKHNSFKFQTFLMRKKLASAPLTDFSSSFLQSHRLCHSITLWSSLSSTKFPNNTTFPKCVCNVGNQFQ